MTAEINKNFKAAMAVAGVQMHEQMAELLIQVYELVKKKKGKTDMYSILGVKDRVEKLYPVSTDKDLLLQQLKTLVEHCQKNLNADDHVVKGAETLIQVLDRP